MKSKNELLGLAQRTIQQLEFEHYVKTRWVPRQSDDTLHDVKLAILREIRVRRNDARALKR